MDNKAFDIIDARYKHEDCCNLLRPLYREKIPTWLLRNKIQTCLKIVKLLHKQSNHTPHDQTVGATAFVVPTVWQCVEPFTLLVVNTILFYSPKRSDSLWDLPSLLYSGHRWFFSSGKLTLPNLVAGICTAKFNTNNCAFFPYSEFV